MRFESADYFRGLDLAKPETYRVAKRNGGGSAYGKTGDFGVRTETSPARSTKEEEDDKNKREVVTHQSRKPRRRLYHVATMFDVKTGKLFHCIKEGCPYVKNVPPQF